MLTLIQAAAAAAKVTALVLILIYDDGTGLKLDAGDTIIGPDSMTGCEAYGKVAAQHVMSMRDEFPGLVAVAPVCFETPDPRPDVEEFLKNHSAQPQSAPAPTKHIPGPGEAAFEGHAGIMNIKA